MLDVHDILDKYDINEEKFFKLLMSITKIARTRKLEEEDFIKFLNGSFVFHNHIPPQDFIALLRQEISLNLDENMI